MADDDWGSIELGWREKMLDGSFETDALGKDGFGHLRLRRNGHVFETEAAMLSYSSGISGDFEGAKRFTRAFLDQSPKARRALMTLWGEAHRFTQRQARASRG